jgi:hypothetical protein
MTAGTTRSGFRCFGDFRSDGMRTDPEFGRVIGREGLQAEVDVWKSLVPRRVSRRSRRRRIGGHRMGNHLRRCWRVRIVGRDGVTHVKI